MFKFKGFRASLNFGGGRSEQPEIGSAEISVIGSYKSYKDEYFANGRIEDPPIKVAPSRVTLPPGREPVVPMRKRHTAQSSKQQNVLGKNDIKVTRSNEVSLDPRGASTNVRASAPAPLKPERRLKSQDREAKILEKQRITEQKNREKEQLRIEKQQLEEQKKRDKLAAQEQARLVKMKRENEKKAEQERKAAEAARKIKVRAPPKQTPQRNQPRKPERMNPLAQVTVAKQQQFTSNTLESSVSKSSGPPPYTEVANVVPNTQDNTGNTSFVKKVDESSSWDLISQHRQEIKRPVQKPREKRKQIVMDLNYNFNEAQNNNNDKSEA